VVAIASSFSLPLERAALSRLPYPVGADGPLVCLDLETTGLGTGTGTLAFLVGIGVWQGGVLDIRQFVLPDHADEEAMLSAVGAAIPSDGQLVTYNGRSFDWPLLVARFRLHRRDPPEPAGHLDLLPIARQLWKHRLGNARLATVEQAICGVVRGADLAGALVPERYFSYLRLRQAGLLRDVVEHNRQDIVSLGLLLRTLASHAPRGITFPTVHPGDLAGLARAYARHGRHADALACVEAALASEAWRRGMVDGARLHRRLECDRARILSRLGRREEALAAWLQLARRGGPGSAFAWIKIARYREHFDRDFAGAIEAAQQAGGAALRARAWGQPEQATERDLQRRLPRLRRKATARPLTHRAATARRVA
jgi:uncharacterized protein